jgi:hypothetical protein
MSLGLRVLVVFACGLWAGLAHAQAPSAEPIRWRERAFRLPFRVDPVHGTRTKEVHLHMSSDYGRTWPLYDKARPDQQYFIFTAATDGEYWFNLRTVDHENRADPPNLLGLPPKMRVKIDTLPPQITLRGLNPPGEKIGVAWQIREDDLDVNSLRIQFRTAGEPVWRPVALEQPAAAGEVYWNAGSVGQTIVRLTAADRAGNEAVQETVLGIPSGAPAVSSTTNPGEPTDRENRQPSRAPIEQSPGLNPVLPYTNIGTIPPSERGGNTPFGPEVQPLISQANTRLVNSTRFDISYQPEGVGKSGLGDVTLYWTRDSLTWEPYGADDDKASPFVVDVPTEGVYGFTLVAKSGVGIGDDAPGPGDPPQVWVEVDLAAPEIALEPPQPGRGSTSGLLFITWQVRDRNLDRKPITLYFGPQSNGPWEKIAANLDNTGRYDWRMPPEVPYQFWILIEARDRAGNIGRQVTEQPVIIDMSRPRIKVLGVSANAPRIKDDLSDPLDPPAKPTAKPATGDAKSPSPLVPDPPGPSSARP